MRYILLLIIMYVFSYSWDIKTTGNMETSYNKTGDLELTLLELNLNNDLYFKDTKIGTSIGIYQNDGKTFNNNVKEYVDKVQIYRVNELYISQNLLDSLTVSLGVFPFKKGTFYEYGYNGNRTGIGLYTLSDANLQGGIITYSKDNHTLQVGSVYYEKYFSTYVDTNQGDGPITFKSYKDSGMNYISYRYLYGKYYSEFMVTDTFQYLNDVKIISTNTYSIALSYDDEVDSGRTYYTILTLSNSTGDNSSLSPYGRFSNEGYHFDTFDTDGYSLLLGFKQELDSLIFNKDFVYGIEFLHRSSGYHSLLAGEPFSYDSYSNIGDSYNAYIGLRFNKDIMTKLRYYKYDSNGKMTKGILSPVSGDLQQGNGFGSYNSIILQLYIDF